jgi:hypothetical protein
VGGVENKEGSSKSANIVEEDLEKGVGDMLSILSSLDHPKNS